MGRFDMHGGIETGKMADSFSRIVCMVLVLVVACGSTTAPTSPSTGGSVDPTWRVETVSDGIGSISPSASAQTVTSGPGSCAGGCDSGFQGNCHCDNLCMKYNDCCGDYSVYCSNTRPMKTNTGQSVEPTWTASASSKTSGPGSCAGGCDSGYLGSCYCDSVCMKHDDCCGDYSFYCSNTRPMGTNTGQSVEPTWTASVSNKTSGPGSCAGGCDSGYHGSCYCDSVCMKHNDCCGDYSFYCSHTGPMETNTGQTAEPSWSASASSKISGPGSCVGGCNSGFEGNCHCDNLCMKANDCCEDYSFYCSNTRPTEANTGASTEPTRTVGTDPSVSSQTVTSGAGSCAGGCDSGFQGNCHCDNLCMEFNDCCGDYSIYCSSTRPTETNTGEGTEPTSQTSSSQTVISGAGSCLAGCDTGFQGNCYCDDSCVSVGDCCADYNSLCYGGARTTTPEGVSGKPVTEVKTTPSTALSGSCLSGCESGYQGSCYCDSSCESLGDCCTDYFSLCAAAVTTTPHTNFGVEANSTMMGGADKPQIYKTNLVRLFNQQVVKKFIIPMRFIVINYGKK
ncbi:uncharacterized protein LOC119730336 isoform X2 [Patiria miniata]|uniref:SMB domain-containing protein n=1 Tax=Patiria miniata TaxID=46514 RepID=A0A914A6R6_PATMI|nr:uncharacterized protein LOC119730336 isoform X2 [Patiria miniata]